MEKILYKQKNGDYIKAPVFEGKIIDIMPVVNQYLRPISIAEIIDLRNNAWQSGDTNWINQVCCNYFDSGDGIIYHPDGRIKIVLDSPNLKNLTPKSEMINSKSLNALNLEKELKAKRFIELPDEINGVQLVFDPKEIKEFAEHYNIGKQIIKNKLWLALARGDENRLGTYGENVYSRFNDTELMKVWLFKENTKFEVERVWSLGNYIINSLVAGHNYGLFNIYNETRLVGVAQEVQDFGGIEQKRKINLEDLVEDVAQARENGLISPALEEIFNKYQI